MKKFITFIICLIMLFLFISCDTNEEIKNQDEQYKVYLLAQEAGFSGTYEEWLASVKGDKGDPGEKGEQGDKGDAGEVGKSAYETFLEYYPDYLGTEKEWITSVAKGEICKLFGHTWDEGVYDGLLGITTHTCTLCSEKKEEVIGVAPTSINIIGKDELYVGYTLQLECKVTPENAISTVIWKSSDESLATVDENGKVTALKTGAVRIKATSSVNSNITYGFKIKITEEPVKMPIPNMGGYEIVIMCSSDSLADIDPFLDGYNESDKIYKQQAWLKAENDYNCKITVKEYPITGNRKNWIKNMALSNMSECDIAVVSSNWIPEFAQEKAAVNIKYYYSLYGLKQMEPSLKQAGAYKDGVYVASYGLSPTATYVDLGLYYNLSWMESLGVKDPAQMFLNGEWNYTGFKQWVLETQSKLNEGEFVFGGHPYSYYYGMSNAAGVKIADPYLVQANIASSKSKAACDLIYSLVQAGCCDENVSWAESDGGFIEGTTLMTTGHYWFIDNYKRWNSDMFGDDTRYGYVPFPYPDDVKKEDTKIGVSGLSVLMYVAGRNYPDGVTTEDVYRAVNDMFLNTVRNQQYDPQFDPEKEKRVLLRTKIDNLASIDCILYYDAFKVFYDAVEVLYDSGVVNDLVQPSINVMYNGANFDEEFVLIERKVHNCLKTIYG